MSSYIFILAFVSMAALVYSTPVDTDKPALSCPENEEYHKCSIVYCTKTCKDLIKMPPCPSVTPDCYYPACDCVENYLRNDEGVCVPKRQCSGDGRHQV